MAAYTLEIAAFGLEAARQAAGAGADRIELCENPNDGGTTPSFGVLKMTRQKITIPVFPIIRPRAGDFFYSEHEFEAMKQDLLLCKQLGFDGIVTGLLLPDGSIDKTKMDQLVELAYPMEVSFHRAFDRCSNPLQALKDLIECGCCRILTSGQRPTAPDGISLIKQLVEAAGDAIEIMPGSGVNSGNLAAVAAESGAISFHASARIGIKSNMNFENQHMNERLEYMGVNEAEVKRMRAVLNQLPPLDI